MWREKHTAEIFRLALNVPKFFLHQHLIRRNFFIQSDVCCLKILKLEKDKTDHASFSTSFEQQSDGLSLVIVVSIMNLIEQGISTNFTLLYSCRLIKRRWTSDMFSTQDFTELLFKSLSNFQTKKKLTALLNC